MKLKNVAQTLLGAAFGLSALDEQKPWWARVGYGLVSADLLMDGLSGVAPKRVTEGMLADGADAPGLSRPLSFQPYRVKTIQERVGRVHQQMIAGTKDPKIYALAREVLGRKAGDNWAVAEKDHKGEVTALFNEVRKRVRYTWDPTDFDAFQTPSRTLELRNGDCDDMTSLLGALCRSVGHQVRSRIVQTKGQPTWNHIYLVVNVNGQWMPLDASVAKPAGWEVPKESVVRMQDFDVKE